MMPIRWTDTQESGVGIAFFDLDVTLLSENSAKMWLRRARKRGMVSRWNLLEGFVWVSLYHLGFGRIERGLQKGVATLRGLCEEQLEATTLEFWNTEVRDTIREDGKRAIEMHKRRGDQCVLLTSSSVYLARLAKKELQLHDALGTAFEVKEGVLETALSIPIAIAMRRSSKKSGIPWPCIRIPDCCVSPDATNGRFSFGITSNIGEENDFGGRKPADTQDH
jgi:phosphoserine phosphatase